MVAEKPAIGQRIYTSTAVVERGPQRGLLEGLLERGRLQGRRVRDGRLRAAARRLRRRRERRGRGEKENGDEGRHQDVPARDSRHPQIIIERLRFDEESRAFEISVRELAEDEGFRRVGFDRGDGWRRLGLGSQIHARVLRERQNAHPAYRCEVHLEARIPVGDWTAVLSGRLDGCIEREPGHWLIEELKSTNFSVDGVRPQGSRPRLSAMPNVEK